MSAEPWNQLAELEAQIANPPPGGYWYREKPEYASYPVSLEAIKDRIEYMKKWKSTTFMEAVYKERFQEERKRMGGMVRQD